MINKIFFLTYTTENYGDEEEGDEENKEDGEEKGKFYKEL